MMLKDNARKISKTQEKYLALFTRKVTDPNTIYTYMAYFQKFLKAIFKSILRWISEQFSNVAIHVGDFRYLKENSMIFSLYDLLSSLQWTTTLATSFFLKTHIKPFLLHYY